jgi:cytochrome b subunit of formate dehydrogenase|tara:strand:- start:432 stop:608 length:177 start_codon:yes stop_codon:yes gene_type:complete
METIAIIIFGGVCFAAGIYVSSQIMDHIDSSKRHKEFMKNMEAWDKKVKEEQDESRKA